MAGELLCKAALSMRGVEPRRSHCVSDLCDDLERAFPGDPLLPLLRGCDGLAEQAHVSVYPDLNLPREEVAVSALRLAGVLCSFGRVWAALCDASLVGEGREWLKNLAAQDREIREGVGRLCSSDCPQRVLRQIQAALETWPDSSELWERLRAEPPARLRRGQADSGLPSPQRL